MSEYEWLKNKLEDSKKMEIDKIEINAIDNINEIDIDKEKPSSTRIIDFIKKSKNPYMFLVDDMKVKIEYGNNDRKINQCINSLIANKINAKNYQ
ncbi:MAG: DUF6870 family protein [Bacilli bacterium]